MLKSFRFVMAWIVMFGMNWTDARSQDPHRFDVVVYGGTPAGIAATHALVANGNSVLLIEPTHRLGGLVTSGLSHTDFRTFEGLSGAYLDFAGRVQKHYVEKYGPSSFQVRDCFHGTFAEPSVNLLIFQQMISGATLWYQNRLSSIEIEDGMSVDTHGNSKTRIAQLRVVDDQGNVRRVNPSVVIDATYEGDLMAAAGVEWRAGREGRDEYGESLAPEEADEQLQAYNFRWIMTKEATNRVVPVAPPGYRRENFLGVLSALESGSIRKIFDYPKDCIFKAQTPALPNAKYDINDVSRNLVRLSLPGKNLAWPNGSVSDRQAIFQDHLRDQVGLLYFLQNDQSVPERFRSEAQEWGWCRDEFEDSSHLPPQLYVREARRMVGQHLFVQSDSEHAPKDARARLHSDTIAMGDYGNNCHGTHHDGPRFGGTHTGEFYHPVPPYQIPYGVIVPKKVTNLLVPTAVSSSHVGFCALRLEPIWMSLGQAAGHAAILSLETKTSVQEVPVRKLQARLHRHHSATIYCSDVPPHHSDFSAVQWWGTLGGLHGLEPMPDKPGQRGANLHGQYFEAFPHHAAKLEQKLDSNTASRWRTIAIMAGLREEQLPQVNETTKRGEFIRAAFRFAEPTRDHDDFLSLNPKALPNVHPPGEVDNFNLASYVIGNRASLPGIVVDDAEAILIGDWQYSSHTPPFVGRGYLHDRMESKGHKSVQYIPTLPQSGKYEVRLSHCYNARRATNAIVTIRHADGETRVEVNQQEIPKFGQLFRSMGEYPFEAGRHGWVQISNEGTDGKYVIADAVQFLRVD